MHTSIICSENFVTKQAAFIVLGCLLMTSCDPASVCGANDVHMVSNKTDKTMVYEVVVAYPSHEIIIHDTAHCISYIDTTYSYVNETYTRTDYWNYVLCNMDKRVDSIASFTVVMTPYMDHYENCSRVRARYYNLTGPAVYNLTDTMSIRGGHTGLFGSVLGKYVSVTTAPGDGNMNTNYCHLHITDEMLGEMQKDYNMLEKFPEYYGKKR